MTSVSLALSAGTVAAQCARSNPDASFVARAITIQKMNQFALGTLAIVALDNLPSVKAGPVTEIACMAACAAAALTGWGAIWYPTCMTACSLIGFTPTP